MEHDARTDQERRDAAAALIEQGRALLDDGKLEAAIRTFDEATSLDETNGAAWNDLAVALFQKGERDMAIGCLYTALRVDPTFADAAVNLATLLEAAGRASDGIPGLRGVLFHDPDQQDVREMLRELGVTAPRPNAIVAVDPSTDVYRVIDACLTEWNHLIVHPRADWVGAMGEIDQTETWVRFLAAVRPATILVDPNHESAAQLRAAAEQCGTTLAVLGEDLPDGEPLVDLARALTTALPQARASWDDLPAPAPPMTVGVPVTHIAHTINLLDRLANQDLPSGLFEVVLADRAYGEPASSLIEPDEYGFNLEILRMEGAGHGASRKAIVDAARGTTLVLFDEETRPATTNLGQHLAAQTRAGSDEAVIGGFRMHPNLVDNSLRKLIDTTGLVWGQPGWIDGTVHGGTHFRANNISVPTEAVRAVGSFDALFSAGCDDTDLGVRLERERGVSVRYDASIHAEMDYAFSVSDFQIEQLIRGWACVHLAEKHDDPRFLIDPANEILDSAWYAERRRSAETSAAQAADLAQRVKRVCTIEEPYRKTGAAEHMDAIVRVIGMQAFNRGIAIAHSGFRLEDERMPGTLSTTPTPVVVRPGGNTATTLASLAMSEGEIVAFVNEEVTAPEGLTVRRGGMNEALAMEAPAVAFVDAGTRLPADWRMTLLDTLEAWPDHGVAVPIVSASTTHNRPQAAPAMIVHRDVIERLGDGASTAIDSATFEDRVRDVGYKTVTVPECLVHRAEAALEQTG